MSRGEFGFVTGGARCGKSRFAQTLAGSDGGPVAFVATGLATDPEMAERIAAHRRERPAAWRTVEEPREVAAVLASAGREGGTVLIDCLGFLVANWLNELWPEKDGPEAGHEGPRDPDRIAATVDARMRDLALLARDCPARVIIVSNEVGWGVVPAYPAGRLYRDLLGRANQVMAAAADRVYLVVSGIAVEVKASGLGRVAGREDVAGREEGAGGG